MPLLDIAALRAALGNLGAAFDLEALETCASTNALLLARADAVLAPGGRALFLAADRQTAGRGRRGRVWISTPEDSLTFSLAWPWRAASTHLSGLAPGLGLALVRGLETCGFSGLGLKWPNDVLLHGHAKLAGILVELSSRSRGTVVVMGFGVNLRPPAVPERAVAGLTSCNASLPERHTLLAALLESIARILDIFAARGFAAIRADWQAHHVWQDRPVRLWDAERLEAEGICRGVDETGALLLETSAGMKRFLVGDLSLRTGATP
ncbi:MAG: biotin--[acetyl-CoA-carboxylase] ligase [Zoogloeaceae bacterium]|jgi:BirA family biotin operon repressor/biotin-[acetyl-CoA-carboxylase] ligase|nr:biotin--[acetyl-CoA-carboxylase] ligase [Zoogloeaceae bacterium]